MAGDNTELISCGTDVILKRATYSGVITGISIRDTRVTYEVSYFENGSYKAGWFSDYEFCVEQNASKVKIGFV